ncbi:DUF2755 domain-containing protein, partial [Klebsiella aerogenes]
MAEFTFSKTLMGSNKKKVSITSGNIAYA